ncbi:unnamed protein product [Calypogeia fissa]
MRRGLEDEGGGQGGTGPCEAGPGRTEHIHVNHGTVKKERRKARKKQASASVDSGEGPLDSVYPRRKGLGQEGWVRVRISRHGMGPDTGTGQGVVARMRKGKQEYSVGARIMAVTFPPLYAPRLFLGRVIVLVFDSGERRVKACFTPSAFARTSGENTLCVWDGNYPGCGGEIVEVSRPILTVGSFGFTTEWFISMNRRSGSAFSHSFVIFRARSYFHRVVPDRLQGFVDNVID